MAMYSDRVAEFNCESKWGGPRFRITDRGPSMQAPQQTD
ncbi:hypothetical protein AJ78_08994 [Emergomyces pasteurianus Ep9510]|uniref:Uncharacterized protein n=1 Tax=Emergomyces pasteurianus Ep9510 TaxID=1447872 RepID=A0A1J9Q3B0_9EURO|nr:hypothetical protein AJ78_08994 [Emergomyces pasteurianus Ep9510]